MYRNLEIYVICFILRAQLSYSVDLNVLALVRSPEQWMGITEVKSVVKLAQDRIREENLLPEDFNIVMHYRVACLARDGASTEIDAVRVYVKSMYELQTVQNKTVHMVYGLHCSEGMVLVGKLAASANVAVMGYVSADQSLADKTIYKTLTRTTSAAVNKHFASFLLILKTYNWTKVAILTNRNMILSIGFHRELNNAAERGELEIMNEIDLTSNQLANLSIVSDTLKSLRNDSNGVFGLVWTALVIIINTAYSPCSESSTNVYDVIGADGHIRPDVLFLVPMFLGISATCAWNTTLFQNSIMVEPNSGDIENVNKIRSMWKAANLDESFIKSINQQAAMFNAMYVWALAIRDVWHIAEGNTSLLADGLLIHKTTSCRQFHGMVGNEWMEDIGEQIPRHSAFVVNENDDPVKVLIVTPFVMDSDCDHFQYKMRVDLTEFAQITNEQYWFRENLPFPSFDPPLCGYENSKCPPIPEDYTAVIVVTVLLLTVMGGTVAALLYRSHRKTMRQKAMPWLLDNGDFGEIKTNHSRNSIVRPNGSIYRLSINEPDNTINDEDSSILMTFKAKTLRIWPELVTKKFHFETKTITNLNEVYDLSHELLSKFIGVTLNISTSELLLCFTNCDRGFLTETVFNKNLKLDIAFKTSFVKDIMKALDYLHTNQVCHGCLSLDTCLVNRNWNVRVSGYGMTSLRDMLKKSDALGSIRVSTHRLLATAPELLRDWLDNEEEQNPIGCSFAADRYSLGMCMYQIMYREYPFINQSKEPVEVTLKCISRDELRAEHLQSFANPPKNQHQSVALINDVIKDLLRVRPEQRPRLKIVDQTLRAVFKETHSGNIVDHMIAMMDSYANNLEKLVLERTARLEESQQRAEMLLHQMLPKYVADNLTAGIAVLPKMYESATVCFADIVGFTTICSYSTPMEVVTLLNSLYSDFDHIIEQFNVYKVETIGDAYMLVSGLPEPNPKGHAESVAEVALHMRKAADSTVVQHLSEVKIMIRVGISSGPVAAGVVGVQAPRYCLFGDTVNKASRMESSSKPMKIQIDTPTADLLKKTNKFHIEYRGKIEIKGKGEMDTHWLIDYIS